MDHLSTGGTLLNQKFTPSVVSGENGLEQMANLVRSYFNLDGHHIQFNIIDRQTLINAQKHPDEYRDLIVTGIIIQMIVNKKNGGIRDMIYTVTFNPSLDYIVGVDEFKTGKVNRTAEELILPGGKGINVSIVLQNLGMESIPLGFAGGFTGEEIRRLLKERKVEEQFVRVKKGISRINVKLRSLQVGENGEKTVSEESEINGMGPEISGEELEIFYQQVDTLQKGDILVLAGSIPTVLPPTIYRDIMKRLQKRKVMIVVDATKDLLVNVLEYHPFLIKPNNYELGEIFGVTLRTKEDVVLYAKKTSGNGSR